MESSGKYQALDEAGKESVRLSFWRDVISPIVQIKEIEDALGQFELRTGGPLKAVRAGPPPTDADLARASGPARMVVTKQGQVMFGQQAERTIHTLRQIQRRAPVLKSYSYQQAAVIVGSGMQRSDHASDELEGSASEAPVSLP